MTDTTLFEAVITQAISTQNTVDALAGSIYTADPTEIGFETEFDAIATTIDSVRAWANQKIQEANQEAVMTGFMAELKVVFDKYAATMEIGDVSTGYGMNYGGGATVGVKFTVTLDGVTSTKEISKAVIVSGDLV